MTLDAKRIDHPVEDAVSAVLKMGVVGRGLRNLMEGSDGKRPL